MAQEAHRLHQSDSCGSCAALGLGALAWSPLRPGLPVAYEEAPEGLRSHVHQWPGSHRMLEGAATAAAAPLDDDLHSLLKPDRVACLS